ncbi:hypothetical protein DM01DRAFT_1376107 [Hesseltinella vesiculosa]|uniref:Methyltransferase domain-containing protein n=1 Tax=Hesseltinella vesiculosa TaxID=101127 RepID=A0A1X2GB74_9FUNG|nr:hypothetical protein DM01DRAFT_1376107 [Hesseltinella vesiculosa]
MFSHIKTDDFTKSVAKHLKFTQKQCLQALGAVLLLCVTLSMIKIEPKSVGPLGYYIGYPFLHPFTEEPFQRSAIRRYNEYLRLFTTNCICRKTLFGSINQDGYKIGCHDFFDQPNCVVYSLGNNGDFQYENDVFSRYGCKIYTADVNDQPLTPPFATFRRAKIGNCPECLSFQNMLRLDGNLNTTINSLKIDIEGSEWQTLDSVFSENVMQIQMEIHHPDHDKMYELSKYTDDFCLVDVNPNVMATDVVEVVFLNKKFMADIS